MAWSRRSFLGLSAAGAAVLALGGVGMGLQRTVMVAPSAPLKALSPRAYSIVYAFAERAVPGGEGFPQPSHIGVAEAVDALMAQVHPGHVAELEQALILFENALVGLLDGRMVPFTQAPAAEQVRTIEAWRTSSIGLRRQVYKAVNGLVVGAYYATPAVYAAVGYPGPPDLRDAVDVEVPVVPEPAGEPLEADPAAIAPAEVVP